MIAAMIPAAVARRTISETWGATGSGFGTASSMTCRRPSGRLTPARDWMTIAWAIVVGQVGGALGIAVLDADRQDPGHVVGGHPGVRGEQPGRQVAGADVQLAERLLEHRCGRDDLGVGLDELTRRAQRVGVGVDRSDEQPHLRFVRLVDPARDVEPGKPGDPGRDEQRPPPASRDREVARELHLGSSIERAAGSLAGRSSGSAAYHQPASGPVHRASQPSACARMRAGLDRPPTLIRRSRSQSARRRSFTPRTVVNATRIPRLLTRSTTPASWLPLG